MTSPFRHRLFSFFLLASLTVLLGACSYFGGGSVAQKQAVSQTPQKQAMAAQQVPGAGPAPNYYTSPVPPVMAQQPVAPSLPAPSGKIEVALLLPLSGKNAGLGQAMLNAAQQAVFDVAPGNFELMPRDTGGNAGGADLAARDATASGAQLVIGPLFAADVTAARPVVQEAGVNMLALSTDVSLASGNVFVMGFAPAAQVERVVNYARRQGAQNFAALIPGGAYGSLMHRAFQESVARNGGRIVALEDYSPGLGDRDKKVQALTALHDQIDALFLPIAGNDLYAVANMLAGGGFDNQRTHLLGTGLWDVPDLAHGVSFLAGAWYAAPDPAARANFVSAYQKAYGSEPPRLATLAYDATALAAIIAKHNERFSRAALTNPNGFSGVDGIFRLTPDGLAERGLAVLEVTSGGEGRVVDPAPTTFVRPAY